MMSVAVDADISDATLLSSEDALLLAALRQGDERAFVQLLERYHMPLLQLAQIFVGSLAVAEEVVQETWLGVLRGCCSIAPAARCVGRWKLTLMQTRPTTMADELTCKEFVELVIAYLEAALDEETERRVVKHLADCDGCAAYLAQMRHAIGVLRTLANSPALPTHKDDLLARFRSRSH